MSYPHPGFFEWSEQWPGTKPADHHSELVTYVMLLHTNWTRVRPYASVHAAYQAQLVRPSGDQDSWYLDFKQPHRAVTVFSVWEPGQPVFDMAVLFATEEAPAFWWEEE